MTTIETLVARFKSQLDRAAKAGIHEPTACAVASVGADGRPSVRMVLLKHVDAHGFVFCTNLESRKGRELAANPSASLLFWWGPLAEQVRVEGQVEVITGAEADAHFAARPRPAALALVFREVPARALQSRRQHTTPVVVSKWGRPRGRRERLLLAHDANATHSAYTKADDFAG